MGYLKYFSHPLLGSSRRKLLPRCVPLLCNSPSCGCCGNHSPLQNLCGVTWRPEGFCSLNAKDENRKEGEIIEKG